MAERRSKHVSAGLQDVSEAAAAMVRDGVEIRHRIADLTARTYRTRKVRLDGLGELVEAVLRGVVAGLAGKTPADRDHVLREVFEGLADAYAATAEHTRASDRWTKAQDRLAASIADLTARAGEDIMTEFKRVADQVVEAGKHLKPKAQAAIDAIDRGVVEPAAEAATHGARKVRRTLSVLLAAAGELLHDLGDTIKNESPTTAARPPSPPDAAAGPRPRRAKPAAKPRPRPAKAKPTRAAATKKPVKRAKANTRPTRKRR